MPASGRCRRRGRGRRSRRCGRPGRRRRSRCRRSRCGVSAVAPGPGVDGGGRPRQSAQDRWAAGDRVGRRRIRRVRRSVDGRGSLRARALGARLRPGLRRLEEPAGERVGLFALSTPPAPNGFPRTTASSAAATTAKPMPTGTPRVFQRIVGDGLALVTGDSVATPAQAPGTDANAAGSSAQGAGSSGHAAGSSAAPLVHPRP